MLQHVEGVKGSQTGRKERGGGPQKAEDPCLDGAGGESHVALWEGAGLREEAESYVTSEAPGPDPSWGLPFLLRTRPDPLALTAPITPIQRTGRGCWFRRRSRLWPKTCPSMGPLATCTVPRGLSPLDLAPHFLHSLRSQCQLVFCSTLLFSFRFFITRALCKPGPHPPSH